MSKSQETFSKREREKQKQKKRQEKAEKMKERKEGKDKSKSLEDMMVYLDENGNFTDTPPDPRKRKEFRQEDIQISVPKSVDQPDVPRTGTVTFFNDQKGYGFINDAETRERIFFHVNDLAAPVKEQDKVSFTMERSPKGPVAVNVTVTKS